MEKREKRKRYDKTGLYFILPSLIGVSIFILIPFMDVVLRSFQGSVSRNFVGLKNYSDVFSNTAFKLAASNAFKDAFRNAGPKIMEPIYAVEVLTPSEYMGAVMSDLQNRRAMIMGME